MDIASRAYALQSSVSTYLVANIGEYTISATTFFNVMSVRYFSGTSVTSGTSLEMETSLNQGTVDDVGKVPESSKRRSERKPSFWYEIQGNIGIYPKLPATSGTTSDRIQIYFSYRPVTLTSVNDLVETPAVYDRALTKYIAAQGALMVGMQGLYVALMSEYVGLLEFHSGRTIRREKK